VKNKDYYIFSFGVKTLLCFFLIFISFVVYGNKIIEDNDKSSPIKKEEVKVKGKESTFKKELKKIEKTLSFKNFFHHSDSSKLANQFIHQHHQLIKGKKDYPYNVDHEKMKLKVNDTIDEPKSQKLKLKLDDTIEQALEIGALVQHKKHDLGIGLVAEKHPNLRAFRVVWNEHPKLCLYISQSALCIVDNK